MKLSAIAGTIASAATLAGFTITAQYAPAQAAAGGQVHGDAVTCSAYTRWDTATETGARWEPALVHAMTRDAGQADRGMRHDVDALARELPRTPRRLRELERNGSRLGKRVNALDGHVYYDCWPDR